GRVSGSTSGDSAVGISLKMARAFSQHRAICGVRFLVSTSSPITFRRTVVTSTMKNTALTHASALRLVGMGDDTTEIRHHRASSSNGPDARFPPTVSTTISGAGNNVLESRFTIVEHCVCTQLSYVLEISRSAAGWFQCA